MCLMASIGLMLLMSSSLSVEAKKPKKYIGENGGDFEFIDEVSFLFFLCFLLLFFVSFITFPIFFKKSNENN